MTKTKVSRAMGVALASAFSLGALAGCAKSSAQNPTTLANSATGIVGCENFQSNFYDELYKFPESQSEFPSEQEMREAFARSMPAGRLASLSDSQQARISEALTRLYTLLTQDALSKLGQATASPREKMATIVALEIGDSTTPEKEEIQKQLSAEFAEIQDLTVGTESTCAAPAPSLTDTAAPAAGTLFAKWKSSQTKVVYGALKTFATAYQSCDAGAMPALSKSVPDVVGIRDGGVGPDGIGHRRTIASISDVLRSHPYLSNYRRPAGSSCYDISKNLPIYDYGGRPSTSSGSFDLFTNSGSGTTALGTDCSGYVYMSIASGGLRIKKSTAMKASTIQGITSALFTNPQKNGLTCFDYVTFKNADTLKSGDIIAKAGHVIIVQSVGTDPWGLKDIASASQCTLANMSTSRFNFTVLQDSPWKSGLGIQSSRVADWLPAESVMPEGLAQAAVTACKAKFGVSGVAKNDKIAVIRHAGSAECMNGSEIALAHESCVASCPSTPSVDLASGN